MILSLYEMPILHFSSATGVCSFTFDEFIFLQNYQKYITFETINIKILHFVQMTMKSMKTIIALLLFVVPAAVYAGQYQSDSSKVNVRFAYDLDFDMQFDNREFYKSNFTTSMTIFGARLTPAVGLSLQQKNGVSHRLMAGIDVMKDFGAAPVAAGYAPSDSPDADPKLNNLNLFKEISLYYSVSKQMGKTGFEMIAGVFPRRFSEGSYSQAFFSDSLRFYDNNLDGLLLKIKRPKAYYEVGCDWMGMSGVYRKERFMIFTSGEGAVLPFMSLGYAAYLYHFAGADVSPGVVDNALVNPWLSFDLAEYADMQKLSFRLGWLQSLQNDRVHVGKYVFPGGGEFVAQVQKWNVGVRNELFVGVDMMPYYNCNDTGGYKYGSLLYMGSPFYRVYDDSTDKVGLFDRLEVYYAPKFGTPYLNLKVSALFYFSARGYSGCRQMVSLNFNLQELLGRHNRK